MAERTRLSIMSCMTTGWFAFNVLPQPLKLMSCRRVQAGHSERTLRAQAGPTCNKKNADRLLGNLIASHGQPSFCSVLFLLVCP